MHIFHDVTITFVLFLRKKKKTKSYDGQRHRDNTSLKNKFQQFELKVEKMPLNREIINHGC